MMDAATAKVAADAIWAAAIVLVEAGHDLVVNAQAHAASGSAEHIVQIASDLATLAGAASVVARYASTP